MEWNKSAEAIQPRMKRLAGIRKSLEIAFNDPIAGGKSVCTWRLLTTNRRK